MSAIASIPTTSAPPPWADDSVAIAAARDVSRRHGSGDAAVDALRGVSLALHEGDFVAVMGPSGSGKSTLMHIMAGLDKPTSGSTSIDGIALEGLRERELTKLRRDRVGFVFQAYNLLPTLSAAENVALPLRLAGRDVDGDWIAELLDTVGLADRARHRPVRALRRPAAARRSRPRPGHAAGDRVRRRADRQPRLASLRPTSSPCSAARRTSAGRRSRWSRTTPWRPRPPTAWSFSPTAPSSPTSRTSARARSSTA